MAPIIGIIPTIFGGGAATGAGLSAGVGVATAGGAAASGGILSTLGNIAGWVGTGLTAAGTIYSGRQAAAAGEFEAKQLKAKGEDERAIANRRSMEARRNAQRLAGRARAVAGASGGTVSDPSVTSILANIEREGEYNALAEMYRGQTNQATLNTQANAAKLEGKQARTASYLDAAGTIYSGLTRSSRYRNYEEAYG